MKLRFEITIHNPFWKHTFFKSVVATKSVKIVYFNHRLHIQLQCAATQPPFFKTQLNRKPV